MKSNCNYIDIDFFGHFVTVRTLPSMLSNISFVALSVDIALKEYHMIFPKIPLNMWSVICTNYCNTLMINFNFEWLKHQLNTIRIYSSILVKID